MTVMTPGLTEALPRQAQHQSIELLALKNLGCRGIS
jgi:hypothetical protein